VVVDIKGRAIAVIWFRFKLSGFAFAYGELKTIIMPALCMFLSSYQ
jgi:hypothetical protein